MNTGGNAMVAAVLEVTVAKAREIAEPFGPSHAYWDFIFDAEAYLAGKKTLLQEDDLLRMAQKIQQEWVDDTVQRGIR